MQPDDSALLHAQAYDPAKAREYYLRTRQLKGRTAGVQRVTGRSPGIQRVGGKNGKPAFVKVKGPQKSVRSETKARLDALQGRLDRLRGLLAERVKQAKGRSGVKTETKTTRTNDKDKNTNPAGKKGSSPLTAKQKNDAAKRSKEAYDKNKPAQNLQAEIVAVQKQIQEVQNQLKDAIMKARKNASDKSTSKTATKGR